MSKINYHYAIYGEIASGKTTILTALNKTGFTGKIFYADELVNNLYQVNQPGYIAIKTHFGSKFVNNNSVKKSLLRDYVFVNQDNLTKLNQLIFPLLYEKILQLYKTHQTKKVLIELGLLANHEKYFADLFDKFILVKASKQLQWKLLQIKFPTLSKGQLQKFLLISQLNHQLNPDLICEYDGNNLPFLVKKISQFIN